MQLTPANCRNAPIGTTIKDHEVRGLQLRVRPTTRTWHLYYRGSGGTQRKPSLGTFPAMSLSDARKAARELLLQIAGGADPSSERQARRREHTVAELCEQYLAHCRPRVAATTLVNYEYYMSVRIVPAWGNRKISSITRQDVDALLIKLEDIAGPSEANHVRTQIRAMWGRAGDTFGWLPANHLNPATGSYIAAEMQRERLAEPDELAAIFAALGEHAERKPAHVAAIITLFLTGCRVGEIESAKVADWMGDRFVFKQHKTARRTKAAKVHYVHPMAAEMIEQLPSRHGKPMDRLFGPIILQGFWRRIRRQAGCPDLQMRDARRTFASYGVTDEASLDQVSQLLGHSQRQTTMRYAHLLKDKRAALTTDIADNMLEVARPKG